MPKSTDAHIVSARCSTERIAYRTPIKFGGRVVTDAVLLNADIEVETRDGRRGCGFGSMPLGNVWAWPTDALSTDQTLTAMIRLGEKLVQAAGDCAAVGHPLEITHVLAQDAPAAAAAVVDDLELSHAMPRLAQLVCASPLEAAIHDAYGKALGENAYNLLGEAFVNRDLSAYLSADFAGEYLDRYTRREPVARMPLYHLVGALDPLTPADVATPVGDGLPETLGEWIRADGLTHL
ncbi:MAG: hypothetical protein KDA41_02135, partial [Planctomycetales bacterium]|nr:hypothetical protein [Planctomycetales bacterium]